MKKKETKEITSKLTPEQRRALLRKVDYNRAIAGAVFATNLRKIVDEGGEVDAMGSVYAADLIQRFQPRDSVEEMLVAQMVVTHGRMLYLSAYAGGQQNLKWAQLMHDAADRASNTFRRLVLALADYRNPRRGN